MNTNLSENNELCTTDTIPGVSFPCEKRVSVQKLKTHNDSPGVTGEVSLGKLLAHYQSPRVTDQKIGGGIIFCRLKEGAEQRRNEDIQSSTMIFLDIDGKQDDGCPGFGMIRQRIKDQGYAGILKTTHSHGLDGRNCYHILIAPDREVLPHEYPVTIKFIAESLGLSDWLDPTKMNPASVCRKPIVHPDRKDLFDCESIAGDLLPVDEVLSKYLVEQPLSKAVRHRKAREFDLNTRTGRVNQYARGHWKEILTTIGVEPSLLDGKAGPCPGCGGDDRHTFDDQFGEGTYYCRGGAEGNQTSGDGIDAAQHYLSVTAAEALEKIESAMMMLDLLPSKEKPTWDLSKFALNGGLEQMKTEMADAVYVLAKLAVQGQITFFFGGPNTGKTLITIRLLMDSVSAGIIQGSNVIYINADDTYRGLVEKLELLEPYGIKLLAPGHKGLKTDMILDALQSLVERGEVAGLIIVVDTMKKLGDLMDKGQMRQVMEVLRQFVSHGGTLIALAHVNKHRDSEGKPVFAGVSDTLDDCDGAYTLDLVDDNNGRRTVYLKNIKSRADVDHEAWYQYVRVAGHSYGDLVDSVTAIDSSDASQAVSRAQQASEIQNDKQFIQVIAETIGNESLSKTKLIKVVADKGLPRRTIAEVLEKYDGDLWLSQIGEHNRKTYQLIEGGDGSQHLF